MDMAGSISSNTTIRTNTEITGLDPNDDEALLEALQSDNLFWRTTAQRLIVEGNKTGLIPDLVQLASDEANTDKNGLNAAALHALMDLGRTRCNRRKQHRSDKSGH